jgi:hypothetical protein
VRIAIVSGGLACLVGAVAVTAALPFLWRYDARTYRPEPGAVAGPDPQPRREPGRVPGREPGRVPEPDPEPDPEPELSAGG